MSYPNFVRRLSFIDLLILASRLTVLNASYSAKQGTIQCFDQECEKYQKKRGKRVFSLSFLDPSSPKLAFSLLGPPNYFRVKEPSSLGEPVTSGVSISSLGRAAIAPSAYFPINRRAREAEERFQGSEVEGTERTKKEEETKLRHYRIATVINLYIVPYLVFFVQPSISFVFFRLNVIYVPLGVPLVIICISIFSIYHWQSSFPL
ncbi:hypothetical protein HKD37_03G006962 [Glycine soja]